MNGQKYEIQNPGGIVLKAIQELSGNGKGWVNLKSVYKFIDDFFDGSGTTIYEGGVAVGGPAHDLAVFDDNGWIKPIDYIPSLGKFVYLTGRGRKIIDDGAVPSYAANDFYESAGKAGNAAV
ncbi:MAG: hypothetical protein KKB25_00335 [Nanoarchaeota archaeon]|nr:hypothetical protein [Nanoarchaeota archaeon]